MIISKKELKCRVGKLLLCFAVYFHSDAVFAQTSTKSKKILTLDGHHQNQINVPFFITRELSTAKESAKVRLWQFT